MPENKKDISSIEDKHNKISDTTKLRVELAEREAKHAGLYAPFLLIPALSMVPALIARLLGHSSNKPMMWAAASIALGVATGFSAAGRYLPWLKTMPRRQRIIGGVGMSVAAVSAVLAMLMGFESLGFTALGVTAVLMLDSPTFETQNRAWLIIGALLYGTVVAAILSSSPNNEIGSFLWTAGAAGWLSVLGGVMLVGLAGKSSESIRIPLVAVASAVFALLAGEYFKRIGDAQLSNHTYALGIIINLILAGAGFAATLFNSRSAIAWGALGTAVFAVLGLPGYTVFLLVSLTVSLNSLYAKDRLPRPAWPMERILADLSVGVFLMLLFFIFNKQPVLLRMGVAALAAVAAVEGGAFIGMKFAKSAYRIFPWKKITLGEFGAVSGWGTLAALVATCLTALAPVIFGIYDKADYTIMWGLVIAGVAVIAALFRSLVCGFGVMNKGLATRFIAPVAAAAGMLIVFLLHTKLFPEA